MLKAPFGLDPREIDAWNRRGEKILETASPMVRAVPARGSEGVVNLREMPKQVHIVEGENATRVGPVIVQDGLGQLVGMELATPDGLVRLDAEAAGEIRRLAELVLSKCRQVAEVAVYRDVEEVLSQWVDARLSKESAVAFSEALEAHLDAEVAHRSVMVPLEGLWLRGEIRLGRHFLVAVTKNEIDAMFRDTLSEVAPEDRAKIEEKYRRLYQGQTVVHYEILGTHYYRAQQALRRVDKLLAVLRFFHPAALELRAMCDLARKGAGGRAGYHIVEKTGDRISRTNEGFDPVPSAAPFTLGQEELRMLMGGGLGRAIRLIDSTVATPWEGSRWQAIWTYAAGMESRSPANRLAHAFSAVEGLLRKASEGEIQGKVARRVGFVVGRDVDERLAIKKDLVAGYELRSKYVHGGKEVLPSETELGNRALRHLWLAIANLLARDDLESQEELVAELERRELE